MRARFLWEGWNESSVLNWDWGYYELPLSDIDIAWGVCVCVSASVCREGPEAVSTLSTQTLVSKYYFP